VPDWRSRKISGQNAELYARPGAMLSAFNQFAAFTQDAIDNKAFAARGKLTTPVLAIWADKLADGRAAGHHSRGHPRIPRKEVTMRRRLGRFGHQGSDLIH
jgi:hypothetical protein